MDYRVFIKGICLGIFCLGLSCKSAQTSLENSEALATLEQQLNSKTYHIEIRTVLPFNSSASINVLNALLANNGGNTASRIDVNGDGYFIKFNDSIAEGQLPFYGEQQLMGNRYGGSIGVNFKSEPDNYTIAKHKKKEAYVVKFKVRDNVDKLETYDAIMTVFPNNHVNISLMSTHRTGINYLGTITSLE